MKLNPADFQLEKVLQALERAAQRFPEESEESASIELAAQALVFIEWEEHLKAFCQYLARAKLPASQVIRIEHEFMDMADALRWLNGPPSPSRGTLVKVAGKTHTVWREEGGHLLLLPSFSPQELEGDEQGQEPEAD